MLPGANNFVEIDGISYIVQKEYLVGPGSTMCNVLGRVVLDSSNLCVV